jgi:UDP-N-acetylmuramoyl-tripeptide--D-alanyl-D-alanine ligase
MINDIGFSHLANLTHGYLKGEDSYFSSISIDTRSLKPGDVYLAIKGEHFDGHAFVDSAIETGCKGLIVEQGAVEASPAVPTLFVKDTVEALNTLALWNRQQFKGGLVGLTGSSGKTSTKNILSAILSEKASTSATKGNFNNEIGVPLTLLEIAKEDHFAVVEMGARKPGDIAYLSDIVRPDVALVLNAGQAHIEIFGSYESIVATKGEIYDALSADGVGVINLDDPAHLVWLEKLSGKRVLSFSSKGSQADVYASALNCDAQGSRFDLNYKGEKIKVFLPMPGLHHVQNGLAASAAAIALGLSLEEIAHGLEKVTSSEGRMDRIELAGLSLLDDSYNANPASVKAALDVLAMQPGYRIAVLGEMAELGQHAEALHLGVAAHVRDSGIENVLLLGPYAQQMAESIGARAQFFVSKDALVESIFSNEHQDKIILVKGSRSAAMDEVVTMLKRRAH